MHDAARATSKIAQSVTLDLNDSRLIFEKASTGSKSQDVLGRSESTRKLPMSQRYNISNDEAYDLLKENHQSKIRSNLGNLQVEHSMPAIRLQWPYVSSLEAQKFDECGI